MTSPTTRTVTEALAAGTTFSFEFMPPKDADGEAQLWGALRELEKLRPSFVSVTYGAGGTTRSGTLRTVHRIATDTTMLPLAHLTAVNHTVGELRQIVGSLAAVGVRNILAVRGDPPGNPEAEWVPTEGGVTYAEELVGLVRGAGSFSVGVAAFPYKHPRSADIDSDTQHFVRKMQAGADYAITQMFFEVEDYLRLRDRVSAAGSDAPILPGVMPVLSMATIDRAPKLSGAPFPPALAERFAAVADDKAAVRALGIEHATRMCEDLLDAGAPGIHFITMNRSKATREIWANLGRRTAAAGR